MSVGKITAALASATNEVTLAAANLNFDFSLVKLDAPKEFSAIGSALSKKRRDDAENGPTHITARKLGALFEGLIPSTPRLISQYGLRASEISASPIINPKGSTKDGLFASQVGLDGTGLWAAATSGTAAISVHLLACMLARIWSGPEATSIWVQIVQDRRTEVGKTLDNDMIHYKTLAAARHDFTRQQLADWDASARAWLYEADKVHRRQQQQLLLILNNIEVAVNHKPEVYDNVMSAWKISMETLDAIVRGVPHEVQNGAVLLGLSAWHLYPDMYIIGDSPKEIKMKDTLVADGGTITLGLQHDGRRGPRGIHWSLSLAHLKYYGKPVVRTRSTESDSSRITFNELWIAALGSLWSEWKTDSDGHSLDGARLISTLWDTISQACHRGASFKHYFESSAWEWLKSLAQASQELVESEGVDHDTAMRLFGLGQRIGASFLLDQGYPRIPPAFGLNSIEVLLSVLSNVGIIILFRQYVEQYYSKHFVFQSAIIRYEQPSLDFVCPDTGVESKRSEPQFKPQNLPPTPDNMESPTPEDMEFSLMPATDIEDDAGSIPEDHDDPSERLYPLRVHTFAYASVVSVPIKSKKRSHAGNQVEAARYVRWRPRSVGQYISADGNIAKGTVDSSQFEMNSSYSKKTDEEIQEQEWDQLHSIDENTIVWKSSENEEPQIYKRVIGDPKHTALFVHEYDTLLPQLNGDLLTLKLTWNRLVTLFSQAEYVSPILCQAFNDNPFGKYEPSISAAKVAPLTTAQREEPCHTKNAAASIFEQTLDDVRRTGLNFDGLGTIDPSTAGLGANAWKVPPPIRQLELCLGFRDYSSLQVLQCISSVYQLLAHATIPCRVVQTAVMAYPWAKSIISRLRSFPSYNSSSDVFHMTRNESFQAIVSFETGYTDIEISDDVMALACGNSVYVPSSLLCDPYEIPHDHEIRRIIGNIGRAGIALLVPPKALQVKDPSAEDWSLVRHAKFDGEPADNFKATTLHLSFTGFEAPLRTDHSSQRDVEIFFLETLISLHDKGSWIADIDVLKALRNPALQRLEFTFCGHGVPPTPKTGLVSVDNWSEMLDKPDGHSIARANKNWLARLALASISVQRGGCAVLLPETPCWNCIAEKTGRVRHRRRGTSFEFDPWMGLRVTSKCKACYTNNDHASKIIGEEGMVTIVW